MVIWTLWCSTHFNSLWLSTPHSRVTHKSRRVPLATVIFSRMSTWSPPEPMRSQGSACDPHLSQWEAKRLTETLETGKDTLLFLMHFTFKKCVRSSCSPFAPWQSVCLWYQEMKSRVKRSRKRLNLITLFKSWIQPCLKPDTPGFFSCVNRKIRFLHLIILSLFFGHL